MTHREIRRRFLEFFKEREHTIAPSSSLLPTDSSALFTTAGMQQFKPYYTGEADPLRDFGSLNTASIQKSMRTSDIDEVGDESHLTFFEMLGNFSFGGYFKKEAIEWAHEFITKDLGLKIEYVSVFGGDSDLPLDKESESIWLEVAPQVAVRRMSREDNFWGPTGSEGPCGPTTEIYINGVEIWNLVFNRYYCRPDGKLEKLKTPGVDTGMGLERLAMVVQKKGDIFETDLFSPLAGILPADMDRRAKRIIMDHARAAAFLISDGVIPSNKERGYVLRRLVRRLIVHSRQFSGLAEKLLKQIVDSYGPIYPELNSQTIASVFGEEGEKFEKTLNSGLKELNRLKKIDAASAFRLYESYGLPYETTKELGGDKAKDLNREDFDEEFKKHQEKSRAGAQSKFGGHGLILNTGELKAANEEELKKVTCLHTATHLLQAALRKILGESARQDGSDITAERLRFDFTLNRRTTEKELLEIEDLVNQAIQQDLPVSKEEMACEDAIKTGALSFFKLKYPPVVNVYTIGDWNKPFSRELCGGPHVARTRAIGRFKIVKEEAVSAGVRRIRATVE